MPKLNLVVPHNLEQQDAQARVQGYLAKLKHVYPDRVSNLQEEWVGNALKFAFSAMGMGVKGTMTVNDKDVTVDGDLPFAAMMFKGKIENGMRDELTRVLSSEKRTKPA
jgi:hypothetical protein